MLGDEVGDLMYGSASRTARGSYVDILQAPPAVLPM